MSHPLDAPVEAATGQVRVLTFGCRLNAYESEVMAAKAAEAGLARAVIVNTCAVTGEAVRQARQAIRKAARENPGAEIIVTGCARADRARDLARMAEVSRVLGNAEKLEAASYRPFGSNAPRVSVGDIMAVRETAPHLIAGFASGRAPCPGPEWLRPSLHVLRHPLRRGNSRSVPMARQSPRCAPSSRKVSRKSS